MAGELTWVRSRERVNGLRERFAACGLLWCHTRLWSKERRVKSEGLQLLVGQEGRANLLDRDIGGHLCREWGSLPLGNFF